MGVIEVTEVHVCNVDHSLYFIAQPMNAMSTARCALLPSLTGLLGTLAKSDIALLMN